MRRIHAAVLATALAATLRASAVEAGVGFQEISVPDPAGPPIRAGLWYPTEAEDRPAQLGIRREQVAPGAAPKGSGLPLVVISHGNGGAYAGHFDTAQALARAGFVAAALTHTGDNYADQSRAIDMAERPRQLKLLADYVLGQWAAGVADPRRVGAFGFSSGGFTVLAAAGAKPEMWRGAEHCRAHPEFFDCRLTAAHPAPATPGPWVHDERIRAVVSVAPAAGWALTPQALAEVKVPVQLWRAGADEVLPAPHYADAVRRNLPRAPEWRNVEEATHFVFLAPCGEGARAVMGPLCDDPPGFDRTAFHVRFNAEVVRFFREHLAPAEVAR